MQSIENPIPILLLLLLSVLPGTPEGYGQVTKSKNKVDSLNRLVEVNLDFNIKACKPLIDSSMALAERTGYFDGYIQAHYLLAGYYYIKPDYIESLDTYFRLVDLLEKRNDTLRVIIAYSRIFNFFLRLKDPNLASKYLDIMRETAGKSNHPVVRGKIFQCTGELYLFNREYDQAVSNLFLALHAYQSTNEYLEKGLVNRLLGDTYLGKLNYHNALQYYHAAIRDYQQDTTGSNAAVILTRIAHIYQVTNNHRANLRYNLMAMKLRERSGKSGLLCSAFLNVGGAYWQLGINDSAKYYMDKAMEIADTLKRVYYLEAAHFMLSDYYYSQKDFLKAFKHYHASWIYKSRMNRDQSNKEIVTLEAHRSIRAIVARNERLEQETRITELKNRNSKLVILLFEIIFLILFALLLYIYNLYGKARNRKTALENLNLQLAQEIEEKKTAQAKLERSEALHRFLAENSADVISLFDGSMQRKYISPSCQKIFGLPASEILAMKSPLDLVDPSYKVSVNQKLIEMMRTRRSSRFIYKALHTGSSPFWAEAVINPVVSQDSGEITNIIMVDRNVEERKNHEDKIAANARQKEILLREIHNRVKNNFAILFSLMNMQRDQTSDINLKNALADLQLRVKTMSLVHEQLYKTNEISTIPFNNYVSTLAGIIDSSFKNNRIILKTELVPCELNIEMTLPLGLIINELITNAYKYAFPGERSGMVLVKLQETGPDEFCITICDNGIGLPDNFSMNATESMGSQIIGILVAQIEARLEVANDDGACFRIFFSSKNNV